MKRGNFFRMSIVKAAMALALTTPPIANANEVWLAATPGSSITELFEQKEMWATALAHLNVVKFYTKQIAELSDSQLAAAVKFLKSNNIAIAIEFGPIQSDASCGPLEGFGSASAATQLANRIRKAEGTISYIAMDEPYWFGSLYSGAGQCHWAPERVARSARPVFEAFRSVFPSVKFGDIEPVRKAPGVDLLGTYEIWMEAWKAEFGEPLAFFDLDVVWSDYSPTILRDLHAVLIDQAIPMGVIYNADNKEASDSDWMRAAESHLELVEDIDKVEPERAIIQSWDDHPMKLFPESDPSALTNLVLTYAKAKTEFSHLSWGPTVSGRLQRSDGLGVAGVPIRLFAPAYFGDFEQRGIGIAPRRAVKVVIGWRANTECGCDGQGSLLIRNGEVAIDGVDATNLAAILVGDQPKTSNPVGGADGATIIVHKGERFVKNSHAIPVHAGDIVSFRVFYTVEALTTRSITCNVIFLDSSNREISRKTVFIDPERPISNLSITDSSGDFAFSLDERAIVARYLRLTFSGNEQLRPAEALRQWTLP